MNTVQKLLIGIVVALAGVFTAIAVADNGSPATGHIGICHHTGKSVAHEWVYITPDASGVLDGHGKLLHQFEEDIIPAFVLINAHKQTISFPGRNLTTRYGADLEPNPNGTLVGAVLLANKCVAPSSTTSTSTSTTPGTTTITTPGTTTKVTTPATTITVTTPGGTTTIKGHSAPPPKHKKHPFTPPKAKAPFTR